MNTQENDLATLFAESLSNDDILMLGTTVDTGFEWEAVDECKEKFNKDIKLVRERGKIYFNIHRNEFTQVQEMRSIDNIYIVADVRKFQFDGTAKESDIQLLKDAVHNDMKLEKFLNVWKELTGFKGNVYPTMEEHETAAKDHKVSNKDTVESTSKGKKRGLDPSEAKEGDVLKYRVTCERTGVHLFESSDVARAIGGELQDKYHWLVDLTMYQLEIFCKLVNDELITQLRITHESKHRRNISCFGPTTLRATVCYNLLRLAHPRPGEIIMDPMCGGGSIPIEAASAYPKCYILCGDNHPKAVDRTKSNIESSIAPCNIDLVHWSAFELPLPDSSVDIIVTDMPFGKRSGSTVDNRVLYKQCIAEFARVSRLSTGRMVCLTYDRRNFNQALQAARNLIWVTKMLGVNIGGLQAAVYVLKRTNIAHKQIKP